MSVRCCVLQPTAGSSATSAREGEAAQGREPSRAGSHRTGGEPYAEGSIGGRHCVVHKERRFDPKSRVLLAIVEAVAADGITHHRSLFSLFGMLADSGKIQSVNESVMLIINRQSSWLSLDGFLVCMHRRCMFVFSMDGVLEPADCQDQAACRLRAAAWQRARRGCLVRLGCREGKHAMLKAASPP